MPVFHLVGMPNLPAQAAHAIVHHTLGNGEFDFFHKMAEKVVCASAIMTPQNVAYETERLIAEALYHRRPVYMAFPTDVANQPVVSTAAPLDPPRSDPASLEKAVAAISEALHAAKTACILPGVLANRAGLQDAVQAFVDASGLPFATMLMDKSTLEEQQPAYIGMYDGKLMDEAVREQGDVVRGFTGDGIMAVFGAPVAFEDAPLRACRAALNILQRLKAAGSGLEALSNDLAKVLKSQSRDVRAHVVNRETLSK